MRMNAAFSLLFAAFCAMANSSEAQMVNVTFNVGPGGLVYTAPGVECRGTCNVPAYKGSTYQFVMKPDRYFNFNGWTGGCSGKSENCFLTVNGNMTVGATFTDVGPPKVTLTLGVQGVGYLSYSFDGKQYSCNSYQCTFTQRQGESLTFTATPSTTYRFSSWLGACSSVTATTCSRTLQGNTAVTARFAPKNSGPITE